MLVNHKFKYITFLSLNLCKQQDNLVPLKTSTQNAHIQSLCLLFFIQFLFLNQMIALQEL